MAAGTTLFLIRHGETEWNRDKRIQGHLDIPLSPEGVRQAEQLATCGDLGGNLAGDDSAALDALYSSDLARARQTAAPLGRAVGLPVRTTHHLRERHYGIFQGLTPGEIEVRHPDAFARWQSRDASFAMPEGESLAAFHARVVAYVQTLIAQHAGQRIALVAHGGVLDCVYRFATGMALDAPRTYPLLNASLNRIDADAEGYRVTSWGDVSHLAETAGDEISDGGKVSRAHSLADHKSRTPPASGAANPKWR